MMKNTKGTIEIAVDLIKCKGCGICHGFCQPKVFTLARDGKPIVSFPERCNACLLCDLRCPDFAIDLEVGA